MKANAIEILNSLFTRYPQLVICRQNVERAFHVLEDCYTAGGKVLVCGNGGSAADSEHIVGELMKGFVKRRPLTPEETGLLKAAFPDEGAHLSAGLQRALPAISLCSQTALMTAIGNDISLDMVFAQQAFGYGKRGDVLIGLSTSGNAMNVVNAVKVAKAFGLTTVGITAAGGGLMEKICDITILLPETETYKVQELTLPLYHTLCLMLEYSFFTECN